jgi:hypothetical protein
MNEEEIAVKYLLMIYMNPQLFESLSEQQRQEVFDGHAGLIKLLNDSGEMVRTDALADPANSATVRVRGGAVAVTDGPYAEAKEFLAGYYLVDCESRERAIELAAMIPDAGFNAIEVRPIMHEGANDY